MTWSTRNRLPSTIVEVIEGEVAANVSLRVGDNHLVALITRESVDELGLQTGRYEGHRSCQGYGRRNPHRGGWHSLGSLREPRQITS